MSTYAASGVDVDAAEAFTHDIAAGVTSTWGENVVGRFGQFAAGVVVPPGYVEPVLMMTTDGVGTKLDLAKRLGRYETVGDDLVAMCVDDLAAQGAVPLGFTDYLAVGRLDPPRDATIVRSIASACRKAGCALLGGETAVHPGVMDADQVDLAGAALGVCERSRLIEPGSIRPGDCIIGLRSPNVRANGFSLIRAVFEEKDYRRAFGGSTLGDVLLEPSVIYSPLLAVATKSIAPKAMAHITGGGLPGNISRILPEGVGARIDTSSWTPPPIFELIQATGRVESEEMFRTFNMGIGFAVVVTPQSASDLLGNLSQAGGEAVAIGEAVAGSGVELV